MESTPFAAFFNSVPGADTLRQLSASLVDLHHVRRSSVAGIREADRVLVARSPESLAAIRMGDPILDDTGTVRSFAGAREGLVGVVLAPLPWPPLGQASAFRRTFSGIG